ncbi:MAG: tRNA (cytidine(34)-2'-O)-methyltransferase [Eubacteriales bacterium]
MPFNIVLVEPEIPQNTGNIARTCAATGATLHLVEPLGFTITDRALKRAGLDYWDKLGVIFHKSLDDVFAAYPDVPYVFFSTKGHKTHAEITYPPGAFLVFGKETAGLPESLVFTNLERVARIPMRDGLRSLNLSNSVAVGLYEALRQNNFNFSL